MERLPDHIKGLLITGIGVLILTPDSLLVRLIAIDPWTMIFWRGLLFALVLLAYLFATQGRRVPGLFIKMDAPDLAVGVLFAGSAVLFITALSYTSVAKTLIIVSAVPLFAAIFSRLFLTEAVRPRTWGAILAALGGIAVIVSDSLHSGTLLGDAAALGTAVCMAAGMSIVRHKRAQGLLPAMALSGLLSALVALPLASSIAMDAHQAWLMALLGLAVLPLSFVLTMLGPRYLPAPEVGLIMLLETVLGPYWVWLALGEEPGRRALIGGAIVIATLIVHSSLTLRRGKTRAA